jgi:hypothetical protein
MNYFRVHEADQFTFFRIPKALFQGKYQKLTTDARLLYGLLLDRMSLSRKNNWVDEEGRVFIIFTRENVGELLGYSKPKVISLFNELKAASLLYEERQGLTKPNLLYLKKFIESPDTHLKSKMFTSEGKEILPQGVNNVYLKNEKIFTSGSKNNSPQEVNNVYPSYTDINDTEISDTEIDRQPASELIQILKQANIETLKKHYPLYQEELTEIELLIVEMWKAPAIRLGDNILQNEDVRNILKRITSDHVMYSLECFNRESSKKPIKNAAGYFRSILLQSVSEMNLSYSAKYGYEIERDQEKRWTPKEG